MFVDFDRRHEDLTSPPTITRRFFHFIAGKKILKTVQRYPSPRSMNARAVSRLFRAPHAEDVRVGFVWRCLGRKRHKNFDLKSVERKEKEKEKKRKEFCRGRKERMMRW